MDNKKKYFARFGMFAKGAVYSLIGILTGLAAFGQGGEQAGSTGSMEYLSRQPFGQVLLIILGVGLMGYVFWRMYEAFANPKGLKDDTVGYGKRVAYFISGAIYAALSFYALDLALGGGGQSTFSRVFSSSNADVIAIAIGIGVGIKAGYDLYRAYSGNFRDEVQETNMSRKEQKLLINAGKYGHTSRGIVLGLMAFLTLKSALGSGGKITEQTDAFSYIQNAFGSLVLGVIAIGFIGYGIFMFIKAKYPSISFSGSGRLQSSNHNL